MWGEFLQHSMKLLGWKCWNISSLLNPTSCSTPSEIWRSGFLGFAGKYSALRHKQSDSHVGDASKRLAIWAKFWRILTSHCSFSNSGIRMQSFMGPLVQWFPINSSSNPQTLYRTPRSENRSTDCDWPAAKLSWIWPSRHYLCLYIHHDLWPNSYHGLKVV